MNDLKNSNRLRHAPIGYSQRPDSDSNIQAVFESAATVLLGQPFWSRGYCVDAIGINEEMIRKYV